MVYLWETAFLLSFCSPFAPPGRKYVNRISVKRLGAHCVEFLDERRNQMKRFLIELLFFVAGCIVAKMAR